MTVMNRTNTSYAVDEAVTEIAYAELAEQEMLMPKLFGMKVSSGKQEVRASMGELGLFAQKNEGASMNVDNANQQFKQTFIHNSYAKAIEFSRELEDDQDWGVVEDYAMQLGQKAAETMENSASTVFNDAFAGASYTCEDGLSLCNDAHVNAQSGNSQDNNGTNSLTHAGAKTTRTAMRKFKGYEADQKIMVNPDELLVPIDLEEDGWTLLESNLIPGSQNNDANIFRGRYTLYVWEWLTDTNAWFMMDSRLRRRYLQWYQRIALEIMSDASFSQGVRKVGAYMRYSLGPSNWRFLYGNNPS